MKSGRWIIPNQSRGCGRIEWEEEDGRLYVLLKDGRTGRSEGFDVERQPNTNCSGQAEREAKARGWKETWSWGWARID